MGCPRIRQACTLMIHALVDGELDAAAALAVERRIAADPALAAEHARITALQGAVGRLPRPQVSDAFMQRIAAIGAAESARAPAPARAAMPSARAGQAQTGWSLRGGRLIRLARHGGIDHGQRCAGQRRDAMGDAEQRVRQL